MIRALVVVTAGSLALSGCIGSMATSAVADALSGSGGVYASDEDPELVEAAIPFALKTMEGVLVEKPEHVGLLTALASGFVQYGYAFVTQKADRMAEDDVDRSNEISARAQKLYQRARGYAMQGLEVRHEGFVARFEKDPQTALQWTDEEDVPLLYWAAAATALSISASNFQPDMIAQFPAAAHLAQRAIELDEDWGDGAIHEFFISFEASRPGGKPEKIKEHFERALALNEGMSAGTYLSYAENVSVKSQNSREFHRLIEKALAIDIDQRPEGRLANVIAQRRARRLQAASEDLFLDDVKDDSQSEDAAAESGEPNL